MNNEVFEFLKQLAQNNNKAWFDENRPRYEKVKKSIRGSFDRVFTMLKTHDDVDHMQVFRINRDIRFSADKTPYKNHMSVHFRRRKPELRGGYYLHIEPNNKSFIAGGFWAPSKEDMLRIRQEFELDAAPMRNIMAQHSFQKVFGSVQGESLSTAPKGFDKSHADIDLIRMKNWYFETYFTDDEVLAPDFIERIDDTFRLFRPFFDYMSDVLTTDLNGESILNQ
jgi:uncharacterized protein (TIGR02453 family)